MSTYSNIKHSVFSLCFIVFASLSNAQDSRVMRYDSLAPITEGELEDLSWIEGSWHGEAFGAKTEEVWAPGKGGSMMGMFKLYNESEVLFYELMIIREVGETLLMQLKHFNNDMKGWEKMDETVDFRLLKVTEKMVYFDGLSFEYIADDQINVYVVIEENGKEEVVKFEYHSS